MHMVYIILYVYTNIHKYAFLFCIVIEMPSARTWIRKTLEAECGFYFITRYDLMLTYIRSCSL